MQLAQSLANVSIELGVRALLRAALDHHVAELHLLIFRHLELEQLVHTLLKVQRRHNDQVDRPTQIHQIRLGAVLDLERRRRIVRFAARLFLLFVLLLFVAALAQDLRLDLPVLFFVLLKVRVRLKHIQALLQRQMVVQAHLVRDLVLLFHEVQRLGDRRVVLELVLARLCEHLDHVLHAHANLALVQHGAEPVKYAVARLRCLVREERTDLAHKRHGELDTVVRRILQEQDEDLKRKKLMRHTLVHEVREEEQRGMALGLVVAPERTPELRHETNDQQFAHEWQLGVDDRRECSKYRRERQRQLLRMHDRAAEQAAPADQIRACKELRHNVFDIVGGHLVHETRDALSQCLPAHALVFDAACVGAGHLGHERLETRGRHVCATRPRLRQFGQRRPQRLAFLGCRAGRILWRVGALPLRHALLVRHARTRKTASSSAPRPPRADIIVKSLHRRHRGSCHHGPGGDTFPPRACAEGRRRVGLYACVGV